MLDTLIGKGLGDAVVFADTDDETTLADLSETIATWNPYHSAGGEIHCGTNTFRRLATRRGGNMQ